MLRAALLASVVALAAGHAGAASLDATFSGSVSFSSPYPTSGQTLTVTGGFGSYSATPGLPQIHGDLPDYGFVLNETLSGFDATTTTATYAGTGDIFYDGPGATPAGDEVVDTLVSVPLSVAFTTSGGITTGAVSGQLVSGTPFRPAGFPGVVDFTSVNPGTLAGSFTSVSGSTSGTFGGTLTAVPEPAGLALLALGLVGLAAARRR